jgi:hypothetical protein
MQNSRALVKTMQIVAVTKIQKYRIIFAMPLKNDAK